MEKLYSEGMNVYTVGSPLFKGGGNQIFEFFKKGGGEPKKKIGVVEKKGEKDSQK